jgi:hypothetical protein
MAQFRAESGRRRRNALLRAIAAEKLTPWIYWLSNKMACNVTMQAGRGTKSCDNFVKVQVAAERVGRMPL